MTYAESAQNETGFRIERGVKGGIAYEEFGTLGALVATAPVTHIDRVHAEGTYGYRVRAFDADGGELSDYCNARSWWHKIA